MLSLALDTSDHSLLVALMKNDQVLDVIKEEAWQRQSEFLLPRMEEILSRNHLDIKEMDRFIVAKGPGSYTGVRVSLTVGKVLAFDLHKPLYLVSSLEILRQKGKKCFCLMNARSNRSYGGLYDEEGKVLEEDRVWSNEEVLTFLKEHPTYTPCGLLSYLSLPSSTLRMEEIMASSFDEEHLVKDVLSVRPTYLKETYLR